MSEVISYGWIGKCAGLKRKSNKPATNLTTIIKKYLGKRKPSSIELNARNLIDCNGKIIYILCIQSSGDQWMPYRSIVNLLKDGYELNLLLGRDESDDSNSVKGKVWFFDSDVAYNLFFDENQENRLSISGKTYTLPVGIVEEKCQFSKEFSTEEDLQKVLEEFGLLQN